MVWPTAAAVPVDRTAIALPSRGARPLPNTGRIDRETAAGVPAPEASVRLPEMTPQSWPFSVVVWQRLIAAAYCSGSLELEGSPPSQATAASSTAPSQSSSSPLAATSNPVGGKLQAQKVPASKESRKTSSAKAGEPGAASAPTAASASVDANGARPLPIRT